jgi:large subunit ribosomal protein L31
MKADQPTLNKVIFIDSSTGDEFVTSSTLTSKETKEIKGETYYIVRTEVTSKSHPFYTGKQTLVDTQGRVDKFRKRMEMAKKMQAKSEDVEKTEE